MFISGLKWTSWNELKGILVMDQLRLFIFFLSILNIYSTESLVFGKKSDDRSNKIKKSILALLNKLNETAGWLKTDFHILNCHHNQTEYIYIYIYIFFFSLTNNYILYQACTELNAVANY